MGVTGVTGGVWPHALFQRVQRLAAGLLPRKLPSRRAPAGPSLTPPGPLLSPRAEGLEPILMNLVDITSVAERVITDDLEFLISKAVDPNKADFAVITGVQIHNWSTDLAGANFEFVAPAKVHDLRRRPTGGLSMLRPRGVF